MKKWLIVCVKLVMYLGLAGCGSDHDGPQRIAPETLAGYIQAGNTSENASERILVVDTRSSDDYIEGHITNALNVPYTLISEDDQPLYTNGYDQVSTTASANLSDSWLAHLLINQLVNDFSSTYEDSEILFYGNDGCKAASLATSVGYSQVACLDATIDTWETSYPDLIEQYAPGVLSVDVTAGSMVFTGFINTVNYDNVSSRATHHGITYKGGGLSSSSFLQADLPPFCFQELLTYMGASPEGNMADGIVFGAMSEWQSKYPDGQKISFELSWDQGETYVNLDQLFEEKASEFDKTPGDFAAVGIQPRIAGTRESNLNWNPGCIFCFYACVCGITSNAMANEDTWFDDGGTYDGTMADANYYAGRFYPKSDLMPGSGQTILIRTTIVTEL